MKNEVALNLDLPELHEVFQSPELILVLARVQDCSNMTSNLCDIATLMRGF